ncbi:hypothetical protein ACCS95_32030 [Rhizobium ruizarguesonis]
MSDTSGDYLIKLAEERGKLSRLVMVGAACVIGGALVVSSIGLAVWAFGKPELTPLVNIFDKLVTGILALVGAWVGAVIAFYFARDNFESASAQAQKSFGMSQSEQLSAIKVTDTGVMIDVSTALKVELDPSDFDATVLQTAFIAPMAAKGYKRMPIIDKGARRPRSPAFKHDQRISSEAGGEAGRASTVTASRPRTHCRGRNTRRFGQIAPHWYDPAKCGRLCAADCDASGCADCDEGPERVRQIGHGVRGCLCYEHRRLKGEGDWVDHECKASREGCFRRLR